MMIPVLAAPRSRRSPFSPLSILAALHPRCSLRHPPSPQASIVDSGPVLSPTKASTGTHGRKVCNVTRGSSKSTLEISLLYLCFSFLLVTMIVMNSWAYRGPDSGLSAGRRASRRIVQHPAGVRLAARSPLHYMRRQSRHCAKDQDIV